MPSGPLSSSVNRAVINRDLRRVSDVEMCVEIAHGFLPCTRRVLVRHGQYLIDERGDSPGLSGLFLRRDGEDSASGVVAGDRTRRGRVGKILHAGFLIGVRVVFLIEHTHCLAHSHEMAAIP